MTVAPMRGGRDSTIFVLLTPVLMLLSVCLEKADPRVPGKFSFLVLLVPTLLVALTGKRWQGLSTALIAGVGCIIAGWVGTPMQSGTVPLAAMTMPVLLGGALLSIGSLLTLRCDDAQQRIGSLGTAVERIVAAENLDSLVEAILDATATLVPIRVCELHLWDSREQAFVRVRMAFQNGESKKLSFWDPREPSLKSAEFRQLAPASQPLAVAGGSPTDGCVRNPTLQDWVMVDRQLGARERGEDRVPLTSGDGEVFGFLRFITAGKLPPEVGPLLQILANSAGLALKNVRLFERLRDQARRDGLTGLMNRAAFQHEIDQALRDAEQSSSSLALVLLDLDKFKLVNDRHGHQVGDQMLGRLSERWREIVPPDAVLARYGGDEFACILPHHDTREVRDHLTVLVGSLAASPIAVGNEELAIEPSIGVALYPEDAQSADDLFRRADQALYTAKRRGGGIICAAEDDEKTETPKDQCDGPILLVCRQESRIANQEITAPASVPFWTPRA